MDFLRAAKLLNGKVLFVEPDPKQLERLQNNHIEMIEARNMSSTSKFRKHSINETHAQILKIKAKNRQMFASKITFLKSMVLYTLTFLFRCSVYEMWSLINTQLMFYHLPLKNLKEVSFLSKKVRNLRILADNYPTFTCLCR